MRLNNKRLKAMEGNGMTNELETQLEICRDLDEETAAAADAGGAAAGGDFAEISPFPLAHGNHAPFQGRPRRASPPSPSPILRIRMVARRAIRHAQARARHGRPRLQLLYGLCFSTYARASCADCITRGIAPNNNHMIRFTREFTFLKFSRR